MVDVAFCDGVTLPYTEAFKSDLFALASVRIVADDLLNQWPG